MPGSDRGVVAAPLDLLRLALVAAGGAAGAIGHGLVSVGRDTAMATLTVNVTGSLAIGLLLGLLGSRRPRLQGLVGTGFLGGWTTFSAVSLQMARSGSDQLLWLALTVLGSLGLALLGLRLGRLLRGQQ